MRFRPFFILLFYCFFTSYVYGAPTFDAETLSTAGGVSSWSFNHTIGAGCLAASNIVIVAPANQNANLNAGITSVTVDGSAATNITGQAFSDSGDELRVELEYRVGVTTGSRTVVTNFADAGNGVAISARSYCSVNQGTPIGTPASAFLASGSGNVTPTVTVPSAAGELVVDAAIARNFLTIVATVGAGQTQRRNDQSISDFVFLESDQAGAGSVVMDWTTDNNVYWAIVGVSLKPSGAAAAVQVQTIVVE